MKTFMAFQCCLLSIHGGNTFAVVSVFYPYHQNLHYVLLASAHRQGLAADEFLYFPLYMFSILTSISLNLFWADRQINCPAQILMIDYFCKDFFYLRIAGLLPLLSPKASC